MTARWLAKSDSTLFIPSFFPAFGYIAFLSRFLFVFFFYSVYWGLGLIGSTEAITAQSLSLIMWQGFLARLRLHEMGRNGHNSCTVSN